MRKAAAKKIQALEDKIDALQNKQDEIRSKEWEHEKAEEKRKWKRDNASCIEFCKGLLGKVFTFGDFKSVIRHQVDKENGVVIRDYDYVSLYYATLISYRDKSSVCMSVRHMYAGDTYGCMDTRHYFSRKRKAPSTGHCSMPRLLWKHTRKRRSLSHQSKSGSGSSLSPWTGERTVKIFPLRRIYERRQT